MPAWFDSFSFSLLLSLSIFFLHLHVFFFFPFRLHPPSLSPSPLSIFLSLPYCIFTSFFFSPSLFYFSFLLSPPSSFRSTSSGPLFARLTFGFGVHFYFFSYTGKTLKLTSLCVNFTTAYRIRSWVFFWLPHRFFFPSPSQFLHFSFSALKINTECIIQTDISLHEKKRKKEKETFRMFSRTK